MSKPFDLAAAQRGEPIQYFNTLSQEWRSAHFIGMSRDSLPVIQSQYGEGVAQVESKEYLRMFDGDEWIEALALKHGFSLRKQLDGSMALNGYVYEFAHALLAEKEKELEEWKDAGERAYNCMRQDRVNNYNAVDWKKTEFKLKHLLAKKRGSDEQ